MKTHQSFAISSFVTISLIIVLVSLIKWNERVGALFFGGEETTYASGYSEGGFRSITQGMTSNKVTAILGAPLRVVHTAENDQSEEVWIYSDSSPSSKVGNFRIRTVVFDPTGTVLRRETGLYVD